MPSIGDQRIVIKLVYRLIEFLTGHRRFERHMQFTQQLYGDCRRCRYRISALEPIPNRYHADVQFTRHELPSNLLVLGEVFEGFS